MNFIGKSTGGDSGSSTSSRRQQQGGDGVEEDDDEERQNIGPAGQLHHSSPSSSPSSSHHPHQNLNHHQPPYHHHNLHGGWMHGGGGGEPSSSHQTLPIPPAPDDDINTNNDEQQSGSGMMMVVEREHMFDKVVTPSDVGKLNRLVIPKQHAERYFPLDSSTNDKGLLLNFEDRNGKSWRFRYSYWNSSQSYVMTKGWSRFVKDKKLDAGDIVSFQRGVRGSVKDRLFIDWRHRPDAPAPPYHFTPNLPFPHHQFSLTRSNIQHHHHPWNPLFLQSQPAARTHPNLIHQPSSYRYGTTGGGGPYHNVGTGSIVNVNQGGSGSVIYFRSGGGGGGGIPPQYVDMNQRSGVGLSAMDPVAAPPPSLPPPSTAVFESVPVVHGKAAAKRLRLFGVNMDCPISDEDGPAGESPTIGNYHHDQFYHHHVPPSTPSSSTIPYQQLKPYEEETEFHQTSNSSSSPMSLDLGI